MMQPFHEYYRLNKAIIFIAPHSLTSELVYECMQCSSYLTRLYSMVYMLRLAWTKALILITTLYHSSKSLR